MILWLTNNKSLGAACLIAMFLFIQAEKLIHSHPHVDHFTSAKQSTLSSPKGCSICDFQLGKDAEVVQFLTGLRSFLPVSNSGIDVICDIPSYTAGDLLGRGPPNRSL